MVDAPTLAQVRGVRQVGAKLISDVSGQPPATTVETVGHGAFRAGRALLPMPVEAVRTGPN